MRYQKHVLQKLSALHRSHRLKVTAGVGLSAAHVTAEYNGAVKRAFLLVVVLAVATAAAADFPVISPQDVAPGARGVCITEMDAGERVEVPITVLGRLPAGTPEGELVLVRLDDPRFASTGIIAGMSGSPVYVDDRLLGALAYGWPFSRKPIAGVTPFVRMQALAAGDTGASIAGKRPTIAELQESWRANDPGRALVEWLLPETRAEYAALPLAVAGSVRGAAAQGWLAESWRRLGWTVSQAAAGRSESERSSSLRPGDMMAGVLVRGDATLAAGGTITAVDGREVWAFGHPFLGGGSLRMPLARARVIAVLPSLASSFKFFSVGSEAGAIVEDRQHGVFGRLGSDVEMLPVEVRWNDRTYRFELLPHPRLLPVLAGFVTTASHAVHGRRLGDQTLRCRVALHFEDGSSSVLQETFVGAETPGNAAAMVASLIAYLEASPYRAPAPARLVVTIDSEERVRHAELAHVVPQRTTVRPGETVDVRARLRLHRKGSVDEELQVTVPPSVNEGRLDLIVADGASWTQYDLRQWPSTPNDFRSELALIDRITPSTRLVAVLEQRMGGSTLPGGTIAAPPSHVLAWDTLVKGTARSVRRMVVSSTVHDVSWPVTGAVRIPLRVRHRDRMDDEEETG